MNYRFRFAEPPNEKEMVDMLAINGLAVSSVIGKSRAGEDMKAWKISHIPTGHRVFLDYFRTKKLAVEAAKEISRDVDWGGLKTPKQVTMDHLAMGAYRRVLGKLTCSTYGIYTGWRETLTIKGVTPAK